MILRAGEYSMQMFFRGSRDAGREGFDDAITRLGFPGEVTPPSSLPQMYRLMGMDPSEIPNCAGWILQKGLSKTMVQNSRGYISICAGSLIICL